MKYVLMCLVLWVYPVQAAYWDVQIRSVNEAQSGALNTAISALDVAGVDVLLMSWSPDTSVFRIGVGGSDLSALKPLLRAIVVDQLGKNPEVDLARETPNEMDLRSRVCTGEDVRQGTNRKIDAFFASDLRGIGAGAYTAWIDPGNDYCRVRSGENCDGSPATTEQINAAASVWSNMNQCNRWRVRLHHEGDKWAHDTVEKVWVYFSDRIPWTLREAVRACLTPDEFEYIGRTSREACDALNNRAPGLCQHFWPEGPPQ